jgi:hypothetical protein
MRLTDQQRQQAEYRIQTAMDNLLRGDIPPGGRCDLKTLAHLADVNRTGFYPSPGPLPAPRRRVQPPPQASRSDQRHPRPTRRPDCSAQSGERQA